MTQTKLDRLVFFLVFNIRRRKRDPREFLKRNMVVVILNVRALVSIKRLVYKWTIEKKKEQKRIYGATIVTSPIVGK